MGDELPSSTMSRYEVVHHEADDSIAVRLLLILEVQTFVHLPDCQSPIVRVVLHNHLFQVEESALMVHTLSELDLGAPCVWSVGLLAIIALQVLYDELNLESLL